MNRRGAGEGIHLQYGGGAQEWDVMRMGDARVAMDGWMKGEGRGDDLAAGN